MSGPQDLRGEPMSNLRLFSAAMVVSLGLLSARALALPVPPVPPGSTPKFIDIRYKCNLTGVDGVPPYPKDPCAGGQNHWFDGKVDWVASDGTILFTENGPFYGYSANDD